ncbi:phosphatidylinositol-glycan biosynthesis class S protein-domain-containing protein [Lactarius psammicola]|nr:phosphatidylinositol-glycan biosynthesis class S protein-domain-containing protein [Lactarius psammicola]
MSGHNLKDPSTLLFQKSWTRRWIFGSYLALVFLGLPLWWRTTSIERLSLPALRIDSLSGKELHLPLSVAVDVASTGMLPENLVHKLRTTFESRKEQAPNLYSHLEFSVDSFQGSAPPDTYSVSLSEDAQFPMIQNKHLSVPIHQASKVPDLLISLLTPYETAPSPRTFRHLVAKYSPRYRLSFTLLNEDAAAGRAVVGWDVAKMISRWIAPILEQTSELHNFTIESQIRFHAPLAFEPRALSNGEDMIHGLTQEHLKVFVNSAEWTLASSVSNDPVLHFVLFVPSDSHSPLRILDDASESSCFCSSCDLMRLGQPIFSDAFVLPQWGGIVLLNLPADVPPKHHLTETELDHVFDSFQTQLRRLIGISDLPPGVQSADPDRTLTDFQLDTLYRQRAFENAGSSKETLQSIIKLVLPDSKHARRPGRPRRRSRSTLSARGVLKLYAGVWRIPASALQHSSRALTLASRAFFNPGMLALLYFPAEHKYAVYTPLFAPVAVPLVVTLLREVSAWRKDRREKRGRKLILR